MMRTKTRREPDTYRLKVGDAELIVKALTKGEARAQLKRTLAGSRIPVGAKVELVGKERA